jgi:hypothetical protein
VLSNKAFFAIKNGRQVLSPSPAVWNAMLFGLSLLYGRPFASISHLAGFADIAGSYVIGLPFFESLYLFTLRI